jgi:hypothetical protein
MRSALIANVDMSVNYGTVQSHSIETVAALIEAIKTPTRLATLAKHSKALMSRAIIFPTRGVT